MLPGLQGSVSLVGVLIASVLGSVHCVGMCGGFVPLYAVRAGAAGHVAYSLGRLTTYTALAICAGLLGKSLDRLGEIGDMHDLAALIVSVMLIASGLTTLFGAPFVARYLGRFPLHLGSVLGKRLVPAAKGPRLKAYLIGLTTTLLPCGWLYAFVAFAAGKGNVPDALGVMVAFWLGTLPAMLGLGVLSRVVLTPVGRYVPRILAVLVITLGSISLFEHLRHTAHHHSAESSLSCHDKPSD